MAKTRQVFISHDSEEDYQFAHRLASDLRRFGMMLSWFSRAFVQKDRFHQRGWNRPFVRCPDSTDYTRSLPG
ncbi:MAG: hypothetical protein KAX24_06395, partial [Anaerolineae bacterium]|nr:hypothetical protein [Anaerolineae bacterium]